MLGGLLVATVAVTALRAQVVELEPVVALQVDLGLFLAFDLEGVFVGGGGAAAAGADFGAPDDRPGRVVDEVDGAGIGGGEAEGPATAFVDDARVARDATAGAAVA